MAKRPQFWPSVEAHIHSVDEQLGGGQRDAQRPASQLATIPDTTHYSLIDSPLLTEVATAFLTQ